MLGATLKRLGCCGVLVWLLIGAVFATFFIGEYLERPEEEKSIWKAGVAGIWCVGTIFGTGAGLTAFIFLIVNCVKDKLGDDPNT